MKTKYKKLFAFVQPLLLTIAMSVTSIFAEEKQQEQHTPKVSVIVPVYNVEDYIGECLESLINQTIAKEDLEIICVNDGSPDNSLEIIKGYAEKDYRIKIIDQKNAGVSAARNNGIKNATGEYIAFVDSDDYVESDTYETAVRIADENEADILCFGWKNFSDDGRESSRKDCKLKEEIFTNWKKAKAKRASIVIWNKLYRREMLIDNDIYFAQEIKIAEDECFNLCAYPFAKTVVHIPDVFYNYRLNPNSVTRKMSFRSMIANYLRMWKYVNNFHKKHKISFSIPNKLLYLKIYKDDVCAFVLPTLRLS